MLNLTQLETGLKVAASSRTALLESLPIEDTITETSAASFLRAGTDDSSSFCDAPTLPRGETEVRFLDDGTGAEDMGDISSQACGPPLNGHIPMGTESVAGEEGSSSETFGHMPDPTQPTTTTPKDAGLKELTGRSRAILKQYFYEDAEAITFPLGHRTVSSTEPQVYHLLLVLTDETLRMSYTTMEQMVIGAVRGMPVTSASRTDCLKTRSRAQTPRRRQLSGSSGSFPEESDSGSGTDSTGDFNTIREEETSHFFNESDSSGEKALISQSFKEPTKLVFNSGANEEARIDPCNEGFEPTGQSSLDATFSEMREQTASCRPSTSRSEKCQKKRNAGSLGECP